MNVVDIMAMNDQLHRNLAPTKYLLFTVENTGQVTIHRQYGWATLFNVNNIVLQGDTLVITSRKAEFAAKGLFVTVNTNASYSWTNSGELRITAIFGSAGFMTVKISGEL